MSDKHETIEDIMAEMRDATMNGEYDDATVDAWADRIEAAWRAERERAEAMRREKRGNAAKIREAYEFAEEFLRDYGTDWKLHNKLCDMLKSALAAPARNCDVPHKDDHELWLRWQAFCAEIYPSRMSFSTWLLDLAQEGGAK